MSDEPSTGTRPEGTPALLLIDDSVVPSVRASWQTSDGERVVGGQRAFSAPDDAEPIEGTNVAASVSLGGTRLETGAGDPRGAILRVELRKVDERRAFFAGVRPGAVFTLEVTGARFNQAVRVDETTALMHLRYSEADVEACSLPPSATSQFLLADPRDTLGGMVASGVNASPGGLSGSEGAGTVRAWVDDDGLVSVRVEVPYGLLRHLQDPWASALPGTFFEPIRLHAEVEVLPAWAEPMQREHPPLDQPYVAPTLDDLED